MPNLIPCDINILKDYSSQISPWLHKLEEDTHGFYTAKRTAERFRDGEWICWIVVDGEVLAVAGTEISEDDSERPWASIRFCVGTRVDEWDHFLRTFEEWAKLGCYGALHVSRPGWGRRVLKPQGYKMTHHVYERVF